MKIFFAILSIALVAQVYAASDEEKATYELLKDIVAKMRPIAEGVIKDIPTTDAYLPFKEEWQKILNEYDAKKEGIHCIDKSISFVGDIGTLFVTYSKDDATAEMKELLKLFNKYDGEKTLKRFDAIRNVGIPVSEFEFEQC